MISMFTKVLSAVCIFLLIATIALGVLLKSSWKENGELNSQVTNLRASLSVCESRMVRAAEEKAAINDSLSEMEDAKDVANDKFNSLQDKLAAIRCPAKLTSIQPLKQTIPVMKDETSKEPQPPASVVSNIAAVGELLNTAACTTNNNCPKPPEEPSKGM